MYSVGLEIALGASRSAKVYDLIAKWQPRLGLQAWDIRFVDEPIPGHDDEDAGLYTYAAINQADLFKQAQIWIAQDAPDIFLETLVIHELLHLVFMQLADSALSMAGDQGSTELMDLISQFEEEAINAISFGITGQRPAFGKALIDRKMSAFVELPSVQS